MRGRALPAFVVAWVAITAGCGHERQRPATSAAKVATPRRPRPPAPAEWFWEPVELDGLTGSTKPLDLPLADAGITRIEGALRLWDDLGESGRARLERDGVLVRGSDAAPPAGRDVLATQMGAFYMDIREQRIPYVITVDALFYAVHVAFTRAVAEVEEGLPSLLESLLTKLTARFDAEQPKATTDVAEGFRTARGVVAVALALTTGVSRTPVDVAPLVDAELRSIEARTGPSRSALLGVPVDYAAFAAPSGAAKPGPHRALTWLASVPLALVGKGEVRGARAALSGARTQTRAAMILARLVERETDAEIHALHSRLARLLRFLYGAPDDVSLHELADAGAAAGVDLAKDVGNVTRVDKLRKRAALVRTPALYDGWGSSGAAGTNVRVFGGHASSDAIALAATTNDKRPLPSTLDVMVWLGAPEARAALGSVDEGYDLALGKVAALRPRDESPTHHASVYGSLVDAVATWVDGTRDRNLAIASPAAERATMESALAAWTMARHDGVALAQPRMTSAPHGPRELRISGGVLPAFVEPRPDVIAKLAAVLQQIDRGLAQTGPLATTSASRALIGEALDLVRAALRIAIKQANDEALVEADVAALAAMPARLAGLEADAQGEAAGAPVPMVSVMATSVFVDLRSGRALSSATGLVEPIVTFVREPGTGRTLLAVGAHVGHHELVEPIAQRMTDAAWLARLRAMPAPPRAPYVSTFRTVR